MNLFKLDLKKSNLDGQTSIRKKINKKGPKIQFWLTNSTNGQPLLGTRRVNDIPELYTKKGNSRRWTLAWQGVKGDYFSPQLVDQTTNSMFVITNHKSDKKQLRRYDLKKNQFTNVLFEHSRYDVLNAILSADKAQVIGVSYLLNGHIEQHYFNQTSAVSQAINKQKSQVNLIYLNGSSDGKIALFEESSSNDPGKIIFYNHNTQQFEHLITLKPWLEGAELAKTQVLKVKTEDNTTIDAFVTTPNGTSKHKLPLIVIPHGGPIGVSDLRYYSPEIQVLVNAGYSTLQVNYRGSMGYGKLIKQKGMQQWGNGIENDIEAALSTALKAYPQLDEERVCIIGGSYGGYSAIFSLIRSPHLYKCGASFAGVTDLALLFQRSAVENDDLVKAQLREIVGDPDTQQQKLFQTSPVYRANEITKPLFLAHGTDDVIVDIEHAFRLRFAMKAHNIPVSWSIMEGVGHGFDTTIQAHNYYSKLLNFLDKHLKAEKLKSYSLKLE
ncbi:hypothetical protein PSECIP111854_00534 [Pseudoalteromonas sp. CIP111854]|uniref:Peptidase S9 prolyl oligopeptidase catalytic domain-containing protein n=1 Tax=Pseudoalteromonas holothuriae TaxID=2963714 RepID=A0A9W4VML1_9GAMM|nr:prolyl oligopeptidase family serine peptidase [Pseudoalteromonas sp. CIP111854]CAH9050455.1 hypothetical protein PSECIP111854_00534 [Pseudoalteromonas sp. CIP111854]